MTGRAEATPRVELCNELMPAKHRACTQNFRA